MCDLMEEKAQCIIVVYAISYASLIFPIQSISSCSCAYLSFERFSLFEQMNHACFWSSFHNEKTYATVPLEHKIIKIRNPIVWYMTKKGNMRSLFRTNSIDLMNWNLSNRSDLRSKWKWKLTNSPKRHDINIPKSTQL